MTLRMTYPMLRRGQVEVNGNVVRLSRLQADTMAVLLMNRGKTMSIDDLAVRVYPDADASPDTERRCVREHLRKIREKVGNGVIHTDWSRGFYVC